MATQRMQIPNRRFALPILETGASLDDGKVADKTLCFATNLHFSTLDTDIPSWSRSGNMVGNDVGCNWNGRSNWTDNGRCYIINIADGIHCMQNLRSLVVRNWKCVNALWEDNVANQSSYYTRIV